MRGDGQPPPETADAAGPEGLAGIDNMHLDIPDILLPPAVARSARDEAVSLAAAVAAHAAVMAAFLAPVASIGAGGNDLEAIGIEIVTAAPALQSRSTERGRGAASADSDVRARDGWIAPSEQERPAADSRANDETTTEIIAPPPADLAVKAWVEPPRPPDAAAQDPVITPKSGEGRAPEAHAMLRPAQAETAMSVTNSIPAAELLAQTQGGAAARGRERAEIPSDAMAGARAGRRDAFRSAIVQSIANEPPSGVQGGVGVVVAQFQVRRDGSIGAVSVRKSSGNGLLDDSVVAALRRMKVPAPEPSLPDEALLFEMPFTFVSRRGP